jgi:hypothetical protein
MAGEVATAFVTLVPSAKGFAAATAAEIGGASVAAGAVAGKKAGGAMGKTMNAAMIAKFAKVAGPAAVAFGAFSAGKAAVGVAANFEESQNILQAAIGATGPEMERLSALAKQLGAETVFSAMDASDAMVELGKAGLTVGQIMGGGVQSAMALAATEGLNLADAAVAVSNAMSAFGIPARDLNTVADALAGGSKASTASVGSLMQALAQVGPGAKAAGLTLQDTVAILAAFDNMGLKGSDAGTSLKTMLTRLVPQTKKAREAFAQYEIAVYDAALAQENLKGLINPKSWGQDDVEMALADMFRANGLKGTQVGKAVEESIWNDTFRNQLLDAEGNFKNYTEWAEVLKSGLGTLNESELTTALNTLFGSDAGRAGGIFAGLGTDGFKTFNDGVNEAGVAAEMADARTKGFKGAVEALGGAMETLGIQVATHILPALTNVVNFLAETVVPGISSAVTAIENNWLGFMRGAAIFAQGLLNIATGVVGFFKGVYNVIYWFLLGIAGLLTAAGALVGEDWGQGMRDDLYRTNEQVNGVFDSIEGGLASARTSIDSFVAGIEAKQWKKDFEVRTKFTYYDPRANNGAGGYTTSGPKAPKPPPAPKPAAAEGARNEPKVSVTVPVTVTGTDSVAVRARRASAKGL